MNAIDEAMDEKLERLERENEQLRTENAKHKETEQELMDALGPFVTGTWEPLQTLQFAKRVHDKHYESMT